MSSEIVTVFRSRLRDDAGQGYGRTAEAMEQRARAMPGFVDFKTFTAADGERVSLITFASRAAHDAWRDDPAHRVPGRLGTTRRDRDLLADERVGQRGLARVRAADEAGEP